MAVDPCQNARHRPALRPFPHPHFLSSFHSRALNLIRRTVWLWDSEASVSTLMLLSLMLVMMTSFFGSHVETKSTTNTRLQWGESGQVPENPILIGDHHMGQQELTMLAHHFSFHITVMRITNLYRVGEAISEYQKGTRPLKSANGSHQDEGEETPFLNGFRENLDQRCTDWNQHNAPLPRSVHLQKS
ncbi:hypothetical protein T265_01363 [Opisthorchis viverrini]|uniref:Uncharacterized protein n=1 Tax=Opisthorchis viverrini TaxID=6198 RepID=A0A075AAB7_OPIVI|nr:hypothetical protein T265_01363 [Opisthorchis viverrini]KER32685.1 hypothetical protein T265_01363 [Opisthorchis viverrini]